jgi:glycosyltransferase involved in cell wall biosynthesis
MNHVAFVIPTLDQVAGAERQVMHLACGLARRHWRISVVALSGSGGNAAQQLRQAGIPYLSLGMRKGLADSRGWLRFRAWLRRESPQVIHAHLPHAAWLTRWSRTGAPAALVIDTLHTSATGGWGRRTGDRISKWLPDRVSAVSEDVAQAHRSARTVLPHKLVVIPNGVDVDAWRPDPGVRETMQRRLGFGNEFLWFAAGRLDPVKDYPALLWAMLEIPRPVHLAIAGAGSAERELRRLAEQLGIEARVHFLGYQPDILPWMQAADAFVLSSRWEGLPMSLLEAGACALPAVATDVLGTRKVIVHEETGLLAARNDSLSLRSAMNRMMRMDAPARLAMGQRARRRILEQYSLNRVLDQWESLYRELADAPHRTHRNRRLFPLAD